MNIQISGMFENDMPFATSHNGPSVPEKMAQKREVDERATKTQLLGMMQRDTLMNRNEREA